MSDLFASGIPGRVTDGREERLTISHCTHVQGVTLTWDHFTLHVVEAKLSYFYGTPSI